MAIKLAEQTNGPHIYMRLRLDSGRVEEIDAYTTEKGWRYVTSADRTPEVRLRIIAAFHTLYDLLSIHFKGRMPFFGVLPPFTKRM